MHVGVKLINYPHLYYFSHFTHFTLYWRMCEKYQILFKFVLISKFPISIMETTTLFPRHLEKHKFLFRSIEGVAFLTRDIGNYPCLTEALTADHYSTTHLQYSVVKIFKNLYKLAVRRLQVHEIHPAYKLTPLHLLHWPLKYFEQSAAIKTLCNYITDHLELYLNTFSTQILMKCGRRNMVRVLNYFLECVKLLKILFHLNIHRPVSNASMTRMNTVHVFNLFQHLWHAYHWMYYIPYSIPLTSLTWNKTEKN